MNSRKSIFPILIWCFLLVTLAAFDLLRGMFPACTEENFMIMKMVRLPRIMTAIIAGGGLAYT